MKRVLLTFLFVLITVAAIAQTDNTIKFLGIPVDGKKSEMVSALKNKGFVYDANRDVLTGRFNGVQSVVYVSENYGKVDRVIVADDVSTRDEANIRIRYNNLISQFEKLSGRYYTLVPNEPILDDEDISYEISIHKKKYQATFYYNPIQEDEELAKKIAEEAANEIKESVGEDVLANKTDEEKQQMLLLIVGQKVIQMTTGLVWFTIIEEYGKLSIAIYYENENNRPNGDDL